MADEIKRRRGCLFYIGIIGVILLFVLVIGVIFGLRYARELRDQLTDTKPMELPKVEMTSDELEQLRDRIDNFRADVMEGKTTAPLALNARELNALIATDPDLIPFRNRLYVIIEGDQLKSQVSFPAEEVGLRRLHGRYVNADGTFLVHFKDGKIEVHAEALNAKGKPFPENVMRQIRPRNLAEQMNSDPRAQAGMKKIQDIQVKDGKIVVVPLKAR